MAKGKYDSIIDKLPTLEYNEDPTYQQKVDARKQEIAEQIGKALTSANIAHLYKQLRGEKEALEKQLYDLNVDIEATTQMLIDQYEIDGITSTTLETGGTVSIRYEPYAVIKDKAQVWQWCKDNGYEREMQLSWQTLNAIVKERLLRGEPEPDGVTAYTRVKPYFYKD